jgi:hypothetical protein
MQQETAARAAITLANFIRGLAVGALRHGGPPGRRNQRGKFSKISPMKSQNPEYVNKKVI